MKLNGDLIKSLRTGQGLAPTHAATIAGISAQTLSRIENDDENATSMLTVTGLLDLATALGAQPTDLLATPAQTPPLLETNDCEALAGLLLHLKQQTTRADIQHALGWTNERLKLAIPDLDAHLEGTGIALHRPWASLELIPTQRQTVAAAIAALTITRHNKRGMDATSARALHNLLHGGYQRGGATSPQTRTALNILTKTGAVERSGDTHQPSAALLYALEE